MKKTKTNTDQPKERIVIKARLLKSGSKSLYFDYYFNGKREYEFLKLFIIPEKTKTDKELNRQTWATAESIRAKRIIEIQNGEHGFNSKKHLSKVNILQFIDNLADEALSNTGNKSGNYYNYKSLNHHLTKYKGNDITFRQADTEFIKGFITYLKSAKSGNVPKKGETKYLAPNTQHKLFNKLKFAFDKALRAGLIVTNPTATIDKTDRPRTTESKREYLTIDEVKKLIQTDCKNQTVKQAFIFCCLAGLRFGDVSKITWGDFHTDSTGKTELHFQMSKTKGIMCLQISDEAMKWTPDRAGKDLSERLYKLQKNKIVNPIIADWTERAGINKNITFHCSRHTAGTLNLTLGTPIEVVSKLLGHSKISTTQIYAKIVSEAKRTAVDKQNGLFD